LRGSIREVEDELAVALALKTPLLRVNAVFTPISF
jgi:hypothetical protein